jgi:hypothetical protein
MSFLFMIWQGDCWRMIRVVLLVSFWKVRVLLSIIMIGHRDHSEYAINYV